MKESHTTSSGALASVGAVARILMGLIFVVAGVAKSFDPVVFYWEAIAYVELLEASREVLDEAGFSKSTLYWEGEDEDGEGNGEFTPEDRGEADLAWIAYIVAEK